MKFNGQRAVLWYYAALLACLPLRAQVHVGSNTEIRLGADASVGYVASSAQGGLNSVNFGLNANLNGHFYHPNFLSFNFSPYYNQGREYSTADFISGDKGFSSSLNLFSGSNIPLFLTYSRTKTNSGLYGVVGSESSVVGSGSSNNLNLNWSIRVRRLPSLQLGYFHSDGDYKVFGANSNMGSSRSNGYTIGSQYSVLGFALGGSFTGQRLQQVLPRVLFSPQQQSLTTTDQKNLQFTISRPITKSSFFDLSARRSRWFTDVTTAPQNRHYDTINAGFAARPMERLSTGFRADYTSDLSALLLGLVLPGRLGSNPTGSFLANPLESRTRYATFTGYATFAVNHGLSVRTGLRHGRGHFTGSADNSNTAWDSAVNFTRSFHGLRVGTGYTTGIYDFENGGAQTSAQSHTGMVNLSKAVRGWTYSGLFQYSTSDIEAFLPGNQNSLTTEFASTGLVMRWRLTASYRYERSNSIFNTESKNRRQAVRLAISRSRVNFAGTLQSGSGLSILAVSGPVTASVAQAAAAASEFGRLLIPSQNLSFSLTGSYQFARRSTLYGGLTRLNYSTLQSGLKRENQLDQVDFHVRHWYRRLELRAGFRRYHQKFTGLNGLYDANTVYFQVSRHFDVF